MKKLLAVILAVTAVLGTGCSKSESNSGGSESTAGKSAVQENNENTENGSDETFDDSAAQSENSIEQAKAVVKLYLRSGNAEYDSSMLNLMTESFGETYKNMKQSMGHDEQYEETEELPLDGLTFDFDEEKCREIEGVNIPEKYDRAVEIFVTVSYENEEEIKSSQQYAIVVEIEGEWKICFAGSQALAYSDGILQDENSQGAMEKAKLVFEAAQKAYDELSADKEYTFEYMNYISTEKDKFIQLTKENLDEELKNSYFTLFLADGKLSYVVWSEAVGDELAVTYPAE